MSQLAEYDPTVISDAARRLYGKASASLVGSVAFGALLGAAFGAVPLTSLGDAWPIGSGFGFATLLGGLLVGGVIGYVIGDTRALGYRLQAQGMLSQLQLERNTAETASALRLLVSRPATVEVPEPRPAPPTLVPPPISAQPSTQG
ncbi:MAG: hypothetical protein WD689_07110 [Gaiellaceae bacterium]